MPRKLVFAPRAARELEHLPKKDRNAVERDLDRLAQDPGMVKTRKLGGSTGDWRLRVGRWRVRFAYVKDTIQILEIFARKRGYRR